jgi:hypothetical protein
MLSCAEEKKSNQSLQLSFNPSVADLNAQCEMQKKKKLNESCIRKATKWPTSTPDMVVLKVTMCDGYTRLYMPRG